jgi:hypothetical protein
MAEPGSVFIEDFDDPALQRLSLPLASEHKTYFKGYRACGLQTKSPQASASYAPRVGILFKSRLQDGDCVVSVLELPAISGCGRFWKFDLDQPTRCSCAGRRSVANHVYFLTPTPSAAQGETEGECQPYQKLSCTDPFAPVHHNSMLFGIRDTAEILPLGDALLAGASSYRVQAPPSYQNAA